MSIVKKLTSLSWTTIFSGLSTFAVRFMLFALFVFLLVVVIRGMKDEGYTVQAFQVPKTYVDAGYNGPVIGYQLQERVQILKEEANSSRVDSTTLNVNTKQDLNMEVMGVGLSASSIIYHLRELMGKKMLSISGDLTDMDNVVSINLRMTDYEAIRIAKSYEDGGRRAALGDVLDEAAEKLLENLDPYRLAAVYESRGRVEEAEELLRGIIVNKPMDKKWAFLLWAKLKRKQGDKEAYYRYLNKAIAEDENFERAIIALGWGQFGDKNYTDALGNFEKCINLDPDVASTAYTGAALCHREFGEVEKADKYYRKFIELAPDNLYGYGNYSTFLTGTKLDTAAATNIWKKGAANIPESGNYHMAMAAFYAMTNDSARASQSLYDALELEPSNISALSQMGRTKFYLEKDYEGALEYNKRAIHVAESGQYDDEFKMRLHNTSALSAYMLENYEDALIHANKAISYDPTSPWPWSTLAEAYLLMGDTEQFYESLSEAIKFGFRVEEYLHEHPYSLIKDRSRIYALIQLHKSAPILKG